MVLEENLFLQTFSSSCINMGWVDGDFGIHSATSYANLLLGSHGQLRLIGGGRKDGPKLVKDASFKSSASKQNSSHNISLPKGKGKNSSSYKPTEAPS